MFEDFVNYLEEQDRSPYTIKGYRADLPPFVAWFEKTNGEKFSPNTVTPIDLREYRQHLIIQKKYAANTVNRHLASLSAYFAWLLAQGKIERNPSSRIKNVKQSTPTPRWLIKKEQFALSRAMEKDLQLARARYPKRWMGRQRDFSLVSLM